MVLSCSSLSTWCLLFSRTYLAYIFVGEEFEEHEGEDEPEEEERWGNAWGNK